LAAHSVDSMVEWLVDQKAEYSAGQRVAKLAVYWAHQKAVC
jgi:hypothetical protein